MPLSPFSFCRISVKFLLQFNGVLNLELHSCLFHQAIVCLFVCPCRLPLWKWTSTVMAASEKWRKSFRKSRVFWLNPVNLMILMLNLNWVMVIWCFCWFNFTLVSRSLHHQNRSRTGEGDSIGRCWSRHTHQEAC